MRSRPRTFGRSPLLAVPGLLLAGCITITYGDLPPEQQQFLRAQGHCKEVARYASSTDRDEPADYDSAYRECMSRFGYHQ